ncbi:LytTR family DNA-binding domain-containing protein [Actibacterium sp. D379-3]
MTSFLRELKAALWAPGPVLSWVLVTVLVSYSGPFGTYEGLPLLKRVFYWATVVGLSILCGQTVRMAVRRVMRDSGYWGVSLVTSGVMSVLLAVPLVMFTDYISADTSNRVPTVPEMMFLIFIVGVGVTAFRSLVSGASSLPPVATPRLMERVDPGLRGRLIRCSAGDHYVAVYTDKGEARLLMRFSDAMAELDGADGLQVHRSHWVAVPAVIGHLYDNGRLFLTLEDGSTVPVSRNFRAVVAARGLI